MIAEAAESLVFGEDGLLLARPAIFEESSAAKSKTILESGQNILTGGFVESGPVITRLRLSPVTASPRLLTAVLRYFLSKTGG